MSRHLDDPLDYGTGTTSEASGQSPGLLEEAGALGRELGAIAYDHLSLAALETRQAGESLVKIVAMGVITACLLLTAWLALVGAVVFVLVQHSLVTAGSALVLVFAVHLVVAMLLVAAIRKLSKRLLFPATVSRLEPGRLEPGRLEPASSTDSDSEHSP